MKVTLKERRQALRQARATQRILTKGLRIALRTSRRLQAEVVRAFRERREPNLSIFEEQLDDLTGAMLVSYLLGLWNTDMQFSAYDGAVGWLQGKAGMSAAQLAEVEQRMNASALRVLKDSSAAVERKLATAMTQITVAGEHVREGVKRLRKAMSAAGVTPDNPYTVEAIWRTQTQMAYGAARWESYQDPEVQEILWGYKYVTVGDDRVRETHWDLDGMTAPKEDPVWGTCWPPNGWACRCQTIPIFEERAIVMPPEEVTRGGRTFRPGPDKGFAWNPSRLVTSRTDRALTRFTETAPDWLRQVEKDIAKAYRLKGKATGVEKVQAQARWEQLKSQRAAARAEHPEWFADKKAPPVEVKAPKIKAPKVKPEVAYEKRLAYEDAAADLGDILDCQVDVSRMFDVPLSEVTANLKAIGKDWQRVLKEHPLLREAMRSKERVIHSIELHPGGWIVEGERRCGTVGLYRNKERAVHLANLSARKSLKMGGFNIQTDAAGVFRHEMGHALRRSADPVLRSPKGGEGWDKIWERWSKNKKELRQRVSRYATTNTREMFSESFSAYTSPDYRRGLLPKDVEAFMDRLLSGKVKVAAPVKAAPELVSGVRVAALKEEASLKIRTEWIERYAKKHKMSPKVATRKLDSHIKAQVSGKDIYVRVPEQHVDDILRDGRFKTQFETSSSSGAGEMGTTSRQKVEEELFGYKKGSAVAKRPVYGYLGDDAYMTNEHLKDYGEVAIKLKKSVHKRSTCMFGDSWTNTTGQTTALPTSLTNPSHKGLVVFDAEDVAIPKYNPLKERITKNHFYVEAQVHGGVKLDDIESITVSSGSSWAPDSRGLRLLVEKGIKVIFK